MVSEKTALVARFDSWRQASQFVEELHRAGMKRDAVSIVSPRREVRSKQLREGMLSGALGGLIVGLLAIGVMSDQVRDLGGFLGIGTVSSMIGSIAICCLLGALIGVLLALAIPLPEAGHAEAASLHDQVLVVIEAENCPDAVLELLEHHAHVPS